MFHSKVLTKLIGCSIEHPAYHPLQRTFYFGHNVSQHVGQTVRGHYLFVCASVCEVVVFHSKVLGAIPVTTNCIGAMRVDAKRMTATRITMKLYELGQARLCDILL